MPADPGDIPVLRHQLASVLMVDVVGYTRQMKLDERGTHSRLMNFRFSICTRSSRSEAGKIVREIRALKFCHYDAL